MGVGCGLAHKRRKTSPCSQTGLRKGALPLFPLFPPILSWRYPYELLFFMEFSYFLILPIVSSNFKLVKWDASYELLFFMEFAYFLVHYRSCYYQDHRHFFWGIYPAPSLPTGSCIVHPPDFIYVSPGKEFFFHLEHLLGWKSFSKPEYFLLQGQPLPACDLLLFPQCWEMFTRFILGTNTFTGPGNPI